MVLSGVFFCSTYDNKRLQGSLNLREINVLKEVRETARLLEANSVSVSLTFQHLIAISQKFKSRTLEGTWNLSLSSETIPLCSTLIAYVTFPDKELHAGCHFSPFTGNHAISLFLISLVNLNDMKRSVEPLNQPAHILPELVSPWGEIKRDKPVYFSN